MSIKGSEEYLKGKRKNQHLSQVCSQIHFFSLYFAFKMDEINFNLRDILMDP